MRHALQTGLKKAKGYTCQAGRYVAQIETGGRKNRKCKKLGSFATEHEARAAYLAAVQKQQEVK
jgi:hypothetical protein